MQRSKRYSAQSALWFTFLGVAVTCGSAIAMEPLPYKNAKLPIEQRIDDLIGRMNQQEKIDQLNQSLAGDTNPNNIQKEPDRFQPTFGSYLFNEGTIALRNRLQHDAVEKSRLGIPAIFGADVIHGYRTIFPIPLASGCSWNPELLQASCHVAAAEAKGNGVDWTFSPMIDIALDPRWGRIAEGFGESPYAASVYCVASVHGFQGNKLTDPDSIAACLKHFVGYGASEGGRDYSYTDISSQRLWELYLPPYEAGIKAGARTVMSAFNDLNGVPTSANHFTLTEILRDRWGFQGFVVSDWFSVQQLTLQGYAADDAEAAEKAINAGVDMDMTDGLYRKYLKGLLDSGRVSQRTLDQAVRRVLRVKFELGLFEKPYREEIPEKERYLQPASLKLAEELAAESIVLLKNKVGGLGDGFLNAPFVLPITDTAKRIALIGPLADDRATMLGTWAQRGQAGDAKSIAECLRERIPAGTSIDICRGCEIDGENRQGFADAVRLAKASDVVVLCLGEATLMSAENASRSSIKLPGVQEKLALEVAAAGKPVVLVLSAGRPIELYRVEPKMDAILAIWQPGTCGAQAVADILLGKRSPSGKLCVTFPLTTGQIPIFHNMRPRARRGIHGLYQDIPTTPLYEFGHGLSYTTFEYSPIKLPANQVSPGKLLEAEVSVTNTGKREGKETVFWFVSHPSATITQPLKELKHFEKASLAPGESRTFRFTIDPDRDLSYPDPTGKRILDRGPIVLTAGTQEARFDVK